MSTAPAISEKQLKANRRNAQLSTGPRTDEGRRRVRANGLRHGLTGQFVLMPHEDREAWERFQSEIVKDLAPVGAIQIDIAHSIAQDRWRLNRARAVEDNVFALGQINNQPGIDAHPRVRGALAQAQTWLNDAHSFNLLSLYEQRIHRNLMKNTKLLQELQTRTSEAERQSKTVEPEREAVANDTEIDRPLPPAASARSENGFAFSNPEGTGAERISGPGNRLTSPLSPGFPCGEIRRDGLAPAIY
ncbi:MAG TPA: hypothetical protein VHB50_19815 [Bryobacteraceae bacterium]|nr:hypothetical protein [Bryobacteraceae bacterium]